MGNDAEPSDLQTTSQVMPAIGAKARAIAVADTRRDRIKVTM